MTPPSSTCSTSACRDRSRRPAWSVHSGRVRRLLLLSALLLLSLTIALLSNVPSHAGEIPDPANSAGSIDTRFESLEESHRKLSEQFDRLLKENELLSRQLQQLATDSHLRLSNDEVETEPLPAEDAVPAPIVPAETNSPTAEPSLPKDRRSYDGQPPDIRTDEPDTSTGELKTGSIFDEGFKWETKDSEFSLNFHNETQLDTRAYTQANSDPVNQFGFYIPRMRLIFNGRLTKPIEYNVSINKGLGSLDLLDAYLNFNYDPRFQFRIGRFRVPFTYDWYALSNQFLPTIERSVWAINEGYNRNFAAMLHGELCEERVDYALAVANGPRNSYYDTNASKDLLSYLNVRPFMHSEQVPELKHLNLGGSFAYGIQNQSPLPVDFRTSANATESAGTAEAVPSFLRLNEEVEEFGTRRLWEIHAAYYYRQLSLMGAYDGGFNDYLQTQTDTRVRLPTQGWHVQFGYFLTGEEVTRRTFVEPLRPFDLREGKRGPGAWELQARFDHFTVGNEVFTGGLADPTQWTNRVNTVDAGVNWYLNTYTKIYFTWQHAMYGDPVMYRPGGTSRSSDLFWVRTQIYF